MKMTLNDGLRDYYEVKAGKYEPRTWKSRVSRIEHWRTWVTRETQPNVYIDDIAGPGDRYMERYFNKLRPPEYAPSSFNNYRQYLMNWWKYAMGRGWVLGNPMMHVDPVKVPKKLNLLLSAGELLSMLEEASPRDRIGLAIGMNTGLRANDITLLQIGSVNLGNNTLTAWIEKTDEERTFPITAELRVELLRWFQSYADVQGVSDVRLLPNDWYLVPPAHFFGANPGRAGNREGTIKFKPYKRLTNPERIVQFGLTRLGHATKGEGFHTLRRSTSRVLFEVAAADGIGDPIRIPQSLLGHKNRATTEHYIGVTHEARVRDDMLRGKSFLSRAAEMDAQANATMDDPTDGYGELRSA